MFPIHTILHPTDFSEYSAGAFQVAHALARDYQAKLIVLHVSLPPVLVYAESIPINPPTEMLYDSLREKLRTMIPENATVPTETCLKEGDPATEILGVAKEKHCDLIVMGTHGRTGLTRLLMGSVTEDVLRKASCPVLTVKNPGVGVDSERTDERKEVVMA